ncbi:MAG: FliH/SctL family protein [Bacillota bacterium]
MPSSYKRIIKGVDFGNSGPRCLPLRQLDDLALEARQRLTADEAEQAAVRIIQEAEEQASAIREHAFQEGLIKGYQEGRLRAEEEMRITVARMQETLREVEAERVATLNQLEREVVDLAQGIAERIVASELKTNPEVALAIAREALMTVRDRPSIVLQVNPDDLEMCQQARQQFEMLLPEGAVLRILPDPQIERGGCIIDTGQGEVDATLNSRWAALMEALKG